MKGVLLVNMGGPRSQSEMKVFLSRMFNDPCILPFKKLGRRILAFIISSTRYKKSWQKYQLIGGTPLIDATIKSKDALQNALPKDYEVKIAFSYNKPFVSDAIKKFESEGINDITVIPLYPQSSYSTTSSVRNDVNDAAVKANITFINEFYQNPLYIDFWAQQIQQHVDEQKYQKPLLVFSAHSIPQYLIDKGDTYAKAIAESAALISKQLDMEFIQVYQSGLKRGNWIGPDINDVLKDLTDREVVIIPISFVNENLETLYDIDKEIIPYAKDELKFKQISRVNIPEADPIFVKLLQDITLSKN